MTKTLSPAQQRAFDGVLDALTIGHVINIWGNTGMGVTTMLQALHRVTGGAFLTMKDFVDAMRSRHPLAIEETFEQLVLDALKTNSCVLIDDLVPLLGMVTGGGCGAYPRPNYFQAPLITLATYAAAADKKLILGNAHTEVIRERSYSYRIHEFQVADYAFLCEAHLGRDRAATLNFEKIFRFAPELNAHQLTASAIWLRREMDLTTEIFIDYLRSQHMTSNVDLGEVQEVDLRDLKGVDEIITSLETHIVLPLENDELAVSYQLKPKRGVLLAGPPGTGKTTVGRALAHRLKSKFFLIDGTFISGSREFYYRVSQIFEAAKHNAPSIIFIDDSDIIFEDGAEMGLYRYLLTMLDGLESTSAGRVCVMMTAMDVSHLPPALLRSGRIELWLEMRLPDNEARRVLLQQTMAVTPLALSADDLTRLVAATDGFTGADIKRLIEDGKNLFAYDLVQDRCERPALEYFLGAVETVRTNKERYTAAEGQARARRPTRPVYFDG
jgi:ATP-dependent 26S proteasome regulatory subunit